MGRAPEVVDRKLWQLKRADPRKAYSARRASPRIIEVLEQGSKVLHREKVAAGDDAEYVVERGWLIERRYPAAQQRFAKAQEATRLASAKARRARAQASRDPVFQMFVRQLTSVAGAPTKKRACDVSMWSFPRLASDDEFFLWQGRARAAGGALTNHVDWRGSSLRLVSGRTSRLGALFGHGLWFGSPLQHALDALDDDAGLLIDFVEYDGSSFELALDRVPRVVGKHAAALGDVFSYEAAPIAKALRKRVWRVG